MSNANIGFFVGMTTSGRSESIHSFFDGFVNSNTMLNEFVIQYDKAVNSRRAAEEDEDFMTMNSRAVLSSVHPIEAKAGNLFIFIAFMLLTLFSIIHCVSCTLNL